jgi:hypothetical protein
MKNWVCAAMVLGSGCGMFSSSPAPTPPVEAPTAVLTLEASCNTGRGGSAREWNCTADALNDEGRVGDAQDAYRRALGAFNTDDPQRAYALGGLAVTSAALGDCGEAESAIEELRVLAPRTPLARTAPPVCESLRRLAGP